MNERKNVTTQVLLSVWVETQGVPSLKLFKSFRGELNFSKGAHITVSYDTEVRAEVITTDYWYLDTKNSQTKCYDAKITFSDGVPVSEIEKSLYRAGWREDGKI